MNTVVQSSLSNVESKLNALLLSLTTSPTAAGAPAAAVALLNADDDLSSSITTLQQHQENYAKILKLRAEAETLEDRVKEIVKNIEEFDKEIRTVCGDDGESDSEFDSGDEGQTGEKLQHKEIDYRLLLNFARRISKYNHEAATDAAGGAAASDNRSGSRPQILDKDVTMTGPNGEQVGEQGAEPVSSVTKNATQWLDESANMTREVYMVPYPMEERIRMGLMGQVQLAAGSDPDKEVERLIREAEGLGAAEPPAPPPPVDTRQEEAANAAAQAASAATGVVRPPASVAAPAPRPKPKPSALLDLDLYDPDDDDF